MKKVSIFMMALVLIAACMILLPTEAQAASVSDLTFEKNFGGHNYAVTDCKTTAAGKLTIPSTYNGSPVTVIDAGAFQDCCNLTSVTIPGSVTSINYAAFQNCSNLKSVTIPGSVTYIGAMAFDSCDSLTAANIPYGVITIGNSAFSDCTSLTDITISDSVTSIGQWAFSNCCAALTKVYYGGSAAQWKQIAIGEFNYCLTGAEVVYNSFVAYNRSATVIKTSGANIWSKPGTTGGSKCVRTEKYEAKLKVTAKYNNWYKLSDGNWVYSSNVRITDYDPDAVEAINKTFVVTSWGANIWSMPYTSGDSQVIKSVEKTAALRIVGQVRNSTGGLWYKLEDGNWVYSKNVTERLYDPAKVIAFNRAATVMVTGGANIWGQPSTNAPSKVARVAKYESKLNVVAQYTTPAGGVWYQLTDGNWVYSKNIRITDYNPADVVAYKKNVIVTAASPHIWTEPYSSGNSLVLHWDNGGDVEKGDILSVVGKVKNSTGSLWYQLANGGWIYSGNVALTTGYYHAADEIEISQNYIITSWSGKLWTRPYTQGDSECMRFMLKKDTVWWVNAKVTNYAGGLWYKVRDCDGYLLGWIYSGNVAPTTKPVPPGFNIRYEDYVPLP